MTIEDYEAQGGFRTELNLVREMGQRLTTLMEQIPARPHRMPELTAAQNLNSALNTLREEIAMTRDT